MKTDRNVKRSTYNPALDHFMGKDLFKEKVDEARAFLKAHPIPKELFEELERKKIKK